MTALAPMISGMPRPGPHSLENAEPAGAPSPEDGLVSLLETALEHPLQATGKERLRLRDALADLAPQDRGRLLRLFGRAHFEALLALQAETVPELFFDGLLQVGRQLAEEDRPQAAALLFRWIESASPFSEATARARHGRALLSGGGDFGERAEGFLRGFVREAGDLRSLGPVLAGCATGSMLYNISRLKVARFLGRSLEARAQMGEAILPLDVLKLRAQSRGLALVLGAGASTAVEQGWLRWTGEGSVDSGEAFLRAYGDSLLRLFAWRFSLGLSDLYRLDLLNQPKISLARYFERCAFSQGLAAAALGFAMAVSPEETPGSRPAMLAKLLYELAGMNAGRVFGRLGSRLLSR